MKELLRSRLMLLVDWHLLMPRQEVMKMPDTLIDLAKSFGIFR